MGYNPRPHTVTIPYGSCGRPEREDVTEQWEKEKRETAMGIVPPPEPKDDPFSDLRRFGNTGFGRTPILEVTTYKDKAPRFIPQFEPQHCQYCRRQYEAQEAACKGCGAPRLKD